MEKAKQLYDEAINLDFLEQFFETVYVSKIGLANFFMPGGKKGLCLMQEAADRGYSPAQYQMALYYLFERHHKEAAVSNIEDDHARYRALSELESQEEEKGLRLLHLAADQNHGEACLLLGDIFCENMFCGALSKSIQEDDRKAFAYYQKGARAGNCDAMYWVALFYYYGRGIAENNEEAFSWLLKAQQAGCDMVWLQLGECYMCGYGTEQDIPLAIDAFERVLADSYGNKNGAKIKLAYIYRGQFGFEYADIQKAYTMLNSVSKDAEDYYSTAREMLAEMPQAEAEYRRWKANQEYHASNSSTSGGGGCYIATAVYGSYDCPPVWTLRRFRDHTLAETWYGRSFIHTYYAINPTLVKWFGHAKWFRRVCKPLLDRMVAKLNENGVDDTAYCDQNWQ